jgi:hypothetical protein
MSIIIGCFCFDSKASVSHARIAEIAITLKKIEHLKEQRIRKNGET